ncbi:MAG: hypothetical protein K8S55_15245 [Phycisphaerae bacterium]|nr:hypothetical protein [Phycisphaerae bacterium]
MEQITLENNSMPEWLRTAFRDDDEVYLPCDAFADKQIALLGIAFDNVPFVQDHGHLYAPASWLAKEYPQHAEAINTIADSVKRKVRTAVESCQASTHDDSC